VGTFDDEGNLLIVDRLKDLIVPASGHNISPAQLEALLKQCPLVGQACVVGDGRPHVVALLLPDPDACRAWAARSGSDGAAMAEVVARPEFRAEIAAFVERTKEQFPRAERIVAFEIVGDEWLPDSDILTPTAKLKRRAIHQRYADIIEGLYRASRPAG
jgi:long-chain acyl-CoA synthetase